MRKRNFVIIAIVLAAIFAAQVHFAHAAPVDDPDGDGIKMGRDNCDYVYNPDQRDSDGDGLGDACDPDIPGTNLCGYEPINGIEDPDGDGVFNSRDNCDCVANADQKDSDNDGLGDACDPNTPTGTPSYSITKTVNQSTARDGEKVLYTVTIANANDAPGSVTLTDKYTYTDTIYNGGAALTFVPNEVISNLNGVTKSGTLSADGITFTNIKASSGAVRITYEARVSTPNLNSGFVPLSNEATLSNGQKAGATVTVYPTTNGQGQLTINKTVSSTAPANGDAITYTITVSNTGTATVSEATVYDTIGRNSGVLRGTLSNGYYGGRITALGTQTVSGANYDQSTSILTGRGLRLLDIAAGSTVTISYSARVDTTDIGSGVTAVASNTATVGGQSSSAQVRLTGTIIVPPTQPTGRNPPFILPIPSQVQTCGIGFGPLDLDDYVSDPDTPNSNLSFSVDGNRNFQARIDPVTHVLTVSDPSGVQDGVSESLRITVRDPQGNIATRSITYSVLRTTFGKPIISGIPDQIVRKGRDFESFDLDTYTQIGGTPLGNRTVDYYVVGSTLFDVTISNENRVNIEYDEDLFRFTQADSISEELTFVMRGCSEAKDTAVFTVMRDVPGAITPVPSGTHTCVIVPQQGVNLPDKDCDGVPDKDDNCVDMKNPDQRDDDDNGVGDACDMQVSCEPTVTTGLDAGKALQVRVGVLNNMDVQSTTARYTASISKLGITESRTTSSVDRGELGEAILRLRVPECAPTGTYTLTCSVLMGGHTASQSKSLSIKPSTSCNPANTNSTAQIFQMQDVIIGSPYGASYPVTITNNGEQQRSYMLDVDGILPWGDYVFEGGNVIVVPAGESETTNLRVYALPEAKSGSYPFKVTVRSGDEKQDTYLQANVVPEDVLPAERNGVRVTDVFWLLLVVVVLGVILFLAYRANKKGNL